MGLVASAHASGQTTSNTAKTQLLINCTSTIGMRRCVASIDFAGIDPTGQQILCELIIGTINAAGTSTAHTPTIVNRNDNGTVRATAEKNFTAEPTYTVEKVIESGYSHPQGKYTFLLRPDIKPGDFVSIRTTTVSGGGPVCAPKIIWEEV